VTLRLGFAGLGRMGRPMVRNLVRAGFGVTVWNRSPEPAEALAAEPGVAVAPTPRDLADRADAVLTMLADDPASEAVHLGSDGLFAGAARLFVEMGTLSPGHLAALREAAPEGATVIDAPVSGATQAAEDAALLVMVGAAERADVAPALAALGRRTIWLGAPGAGAVMKLAVNAMLHSANQAVAEALTLAERAGIATGDAYAVIEESAACPPMLRYRKPLYLDEAAHAVTFTLALARKDMRAATELAAALGAPAPQARCNLAILERAAAAGYADRDMAALRAFIRETAS
jgi:3-hydroxyisobutyrate dehydrogenase